jgi:hypothetical protein
MVKSSVPLVGVITFTERGDYGHVYAYVMTEVGGVPQGMSETDSPLANFEVSCQLDATSDDAYGWECQFNTKYIHLDDAKRMVLVLGELDRKMRKMHSELGWAGSYGAYVLRTFKALGIKKVFIRLDEASRWIDGKYEIFEGKYLSDAGSWINTKIKNKIEHWSDNHWAYESY